MKKSTNKWLLGSLILISLIGIFYQWNGSRNLKMNGVYTIAEVIEIKGAKGGLRVFIKYEFRNQLFYADHIDGTASHEMLHKRFFIKIQNNNPDGVYRMDKSCEVPDTIVAAPADGWKILPIRCK